MRWVALDWLHDAEILGRVGRQAVVAILELLAPVLAEQGIPLPNPGLPDSLYFAELAALFRSQPAILTVHLAPFASASSPGQALKLAAASATLLQPADQSRYALHRRGELWHLTLNGCPAVLKHEQGLCYVAEVFAHPGEPLKKLNLAAKFSSPKAKGCGGIEVYDPATGRYDAPASTEPVHEAPLAVDDYEVRKACQEKVRELKEIIDDPTETEAAKEAATEELQKIVDHLRKDSRQVRDATKVAGDNVRNAIDRLLHTLNSAEGQVPSELAVRRQFAEHIQRYVVNPTRRYAAPRARKARGDLTGCQLYEPPAGISWEVSQ
jgi:hypothetical protein